MKAIKKESRNGHIVLICEKSMLFGLIKYKVEFIATKLIIEGHWNWRRLPDKTLINDNTSFQLDSWCEDFN